MPCLKILTNIPKSKIPTDFVQKLTPVLAELVKKEPAKFVCVIEGDVQLSFGGNSALPGAVASLESIGNLGPEENKTIVAGLSKFLEKEIGVNSNRFFLTFYDLVNYNVGIAGSTVIKP